MDFQISELHEYIETKYGKPMPLFLELGYKVNIRLLVYSRKYLKHLENQFGFVISDKKISRYDATVVLWAETESTCPDFIHEHDDETNTFFIAIKNSKFDDIINSLGHFLEDTIYKILKKTDSEFLHGAVFGINGKGVFVGARTQGGKSTLAVTALLDGMDCGTAVFAGRTFTERKI